MIIIVTTMIARISVIIMKCDSFRQPDQYFVELPNSSDGLVMVQRLCQLIADL